MSTLLLYKTLFNLQAVYSRIKRKPKPSGRQFILYARTAPLTNVFHQIFKQTLKYINPVYHMFDVIGVLSFCAYINSSVFMQ